MPRPHRFAAQNEDVGTGNDGESQRSLSLIIVLLKDCQKLEILSSQSLLQLTIYFCIYTLAQ